MKRWLAVAAAAIIVAALAWVAMEKAVDRCENMEQTIQANLGEHLTCEHDADCAPLAGLACPWTPCPEDNVPVRAAQQGMVLRLMRRFSSCTYLPHVRKQLAACEAAKATASCIGKIYHNAACMKHRCIVW